MNTLCSDDKATSGFGPTTDPQERWALGEVAAWVVSTVERAPNGTPGFRDLYYNAEADGYRWFYPWSNSGERIEALLWADESLQTACAREAARRYAECMCGNDAMGICLEPNHPAHGMVAYWNECGTWMTNYTMRVPSAFLMAADVFKEPKYEDVARAAGEALLRFQLPNGILRCGYTSEAHPSVTPDSINSRVFYALDAFSSLHQRFGDKKWHEAHERLLDASLVHQRNDGSFPEQVMLEGTLGDSSTCKGHFHAYILFGAARSLSRNPNNDRLRTMTESLANFCARRMEEFGGHCYGDPLSSSDVEAHVWRSKTHDIAAGFACLGVATANDHWIKMAGEVLTDALKSRSRGVESNLAKGAVPTHPLSNGHGAKPAFGGFYSVWTLLAAREIQKFKQPPEDPSNE